MTRLRAHVLIGVLAGAAAVPAPAQQPAAARPSVARPSVARPSVARPSVAAKRASVARAPVRAVTERAPNPRGPFAKLSEPQRDTIIENTRALLGIRYRWAGASPERGLDCSGFVQYVFAKLGIELPHSSRELAKLGEPVTKDTAEMRPGDLLVFGKGKRISHVAIYVGDGTMIHASSRSKSVVETPVERYRPPGTLQWKGVRRVFAVDSTRTDVSSTLSPLDPDRR